MSIQNKVDKEAEFLIEALCDMSHEELLELQHKLEKERMKQELRDKYNS